MKHRTFLAVPIPPEVGAKVASLQLELERLKLPVRWEPAEKLHITLNFLGSIDDDKLSEVQRVIPEVATSFNSFSVKPMFLETLYNRHEPSVIYLGLAGDIDQLKELRNDLTSAFNNLKLPQAYRFMPHITIGKMKRTDPTATKSFLDKIQDFEFTPLEPFEVKYINLYKSIVSRMGSTYQVLNTFYLNS